MTLTVACISNNFPKGQAFLYSLAMLTSFLPWLVKTYCL